MTESEPDFDAMTDEELDAYLTPERAPLPDDTPPGEPLEPTDEDEPDEEFDPGDDADEEPAG